MQGVGTGEGFRERTSSRRQVVAAILVAPAAKILSQTAALAQDVGTEDFSGKSFSARINIGDSAPASPYGSVISVKGMEGQIRDVNVILNDFNHNHPTDVGVMLAYRGRSTTLMRGASDGTPISAANFLLDNQSSTPLPPPAGGPLVGTTSYHPMDYTNGATFGGAAGTPNDTGNQYLDFFNGLSPNGQWTLWIRDDTGNQLSGFLGGWTLEIVTDSDGQFIEDETFTVVEGGRLAVDRKHGLLRTISSPNTNQFATVVATKPTKGTLDLRRNGSFVYEPKPNKTGKDSFTYTIQDQFGSSISGPGKVVIQIKKR